MIAETYFNSIQIPFLMSKQTGAGNGAMNGNGQERKLLESYEQAIALAELDLGNFDNSYKTAAEYYFQHSKRLYLDNLALLKKLNDLTRQKASIVNQLKTYEALVATKNQNESGGHNEKKRRKRRSANQIQRLYQCKAENCGKSYGSEGTLSQHYKLKHPDMYVEQFGDGEEKAQHQSVDPDKNKEDSHGDSGHSNKSEGHNPPSN